MKTIFSYLKQKKNDCHEVNLNDTIQDSQETHAVNTVDFIVVGANEEGKSQAIPSSDYEVCVSDISVKKRNKSDFNESLNESSIHVTKKSKIGQQVDQVQAVKSVVREQQHH